MKIAVCAKITPDTEDVVVGADGSLDISRAVWSVSDYDQQAIQAAADMSSDDDEVIAVSFGGEELRQVKNTKLMLSRGNLARLHRIVSEDASSADTAAVAKALAEAVECLGVDVVICGEGSSDRYTRVTGSLIAAHLGWPSVNAVDKIEREGSALIVERDVEDGVEVVEVQTPCVISVTSTINTPPIPSMKAVLAAGKKPVDDGDATKAQNAVDVVASAAPETPGRQLSVIEGTPEEIAAQLVAKLHAAAVL